MDAGNAPAEPGRPSAEPSGAADPGSRVAQSLCLLALEGASVALAIWALRAGPMLLPHVTANALPKAARMITLVDAGAGALSGAVLGALLLVLGRPLHLVWRLSRRLAPLTILWLLPPMLDYRLWREHELTFLLLTCILSVGAQQTLGVALKTPPVFSQVRLPGRVKEIFSSIATGRVLPALVVVAGVAYYVAFFSYYTIRNHYRIGTASFDMGIENNLVWNAMHWGPLFKTSPLGGPTATHLGYHQTYFAYVLALVYRLAPRPETLLVIQALLMGAAAIPLYLIARRTAGAWTSCLVSIAYLLYAPLHGANLYDFHYLPLATLFLWLTLYFMQAGRYVLAALAIVVTLSVREDISALLAVVGVYLLLTGERSIGGLIVTAIGAAYFVGVKMILMPHFLGGSDAYVHQYAVLVPPGDSGFKGVLKTVLANPSFTMESLLERDKLVYALKIATPLAFLPWRRPIGYLCSVPGFFFTLLATRYPPLLQISFQYTTYWTTFLFLAVIANLAWLEDQERAKPERATDFRAARGGWIAALALGTLVTTHQFGALLQQNTVIGGFGPYRFDLTEADKLRHDRLYRLIAQVPPDAKIVSSEPIVPQISNRRDSYTMRTGVFDADYMLVWMPPRGDEAEHVIRAIKSGTFGVVDVQGEFLLAKRGHDTAKNAQIISRYRW